MNYANRIFFIGIGVFETLTVAMGYVGGELCTDSQPIVGRDFTIRCLKQEYGIVEVQCHGNGWTTFPDFTVDLLVLTKFINCSFAENTSVVSILRSINVTLPKYSSRIQFEDLRSSLSRQNFQNLSVVELIFTDTDFTTLPFDMLYDVVGLFSLVIQKTDLDRIPNNFFENGSRGLRSLDLLGNKLQKIAKNNFTHLSEVQDLSLRENEITEIEAGAFDSMTFLWSLELGENLLHTLPPGIFRHLSSLCTLKLGGNSFDELPDDLLANNHALEYFSMNFNRGTLKTLPDQFFKKLVNLTDVNLEQSQLESLPENLFTDSPRLKSLILRNNLLRSLPLDFFKNIRRLASLDLSENQIVTLPARIFEDLNDLKDLNISHNNLTSLESDVFQGLEKLTKLDASHNKLTKVGYVFCEYLQKIEMIDLSFNRLTVGIQSLHATVFLYCETLQNINLSHNNIAKVITEFSIKLAHIDLSFNNLSQLTTGDINNLRVSKTVDLRNNQISKINLSKLAYWVAFYKNHDLDFSNRPFQIALENNPLSCDCDLIDFVRYWNSEPNSELRQYVKLTATNDMDDTRDLTCASPVELEKFNLSDIGTEDDSCTFRTPADDDACKNDCTCRKDYAEKVLSVDCSSKNLTQLPSVISNIHKWSIKLNMSHNMLKQTPSQAIPYLANVTSLDLSNNDIDNVTMDLFSKNLVDLKLHSNRISRLDESVIKYLTDNDILHSITLQENPWDCDCKARRFLDFIQSKVLNYKLGEVVCHGTNRTLYRMSESDMCKEKESVGMIVSVSLLVAFFGIVIGVVIALYYKHSREIKVWLYSKQWCLWFVTEDELDKDKKYDAFVSFSHKDEDFVENEIVAKMEDGPRPYKLCLHHRDWLAGEWIPVQISQSVEDSRRTIIVLSSNFLESVWGRLEFRVAHTQALKEGRARVIIEIENMDDLDLELKSYLSLNTYVKWGDPWFWDKLRYSLPHKLEPSRRRTRNARLIEEHVVRQLVSCNNTMGGNDIAKANAISMSKLVNESAKLLDSGVDQRTTASC